MRVAIIDHGQANLFSLKNAFLTSGTDTELVNSPEGLNGVDLIVLPGVGSFGAAMDNLNSLGLTEKLRSLGSAGVPILGICLGMQLLFESSSEFGHHEGIGFIPGTIEPIKESNDFDTNSKIPHIGWAKLTGSQEHQIFQNLGDCYMYFVHSFRAMPKTEACILSSTNYGNVDIAAIVNHQNFYGFQFHPEKSASDGLLLISNFMKHIKNKYKENA